jgi:hypothetical protein
MFKKILLIITIAVLLQAIYANPSMRAYELEEMIRITGDEASAEEALNKLDNITFEPIRREINYRNLDTEMVIITNDEFFGSFSEFAAIKNEEGIVTEVVSTSEIGTSKEAIRDWLADQKTNNDNLQYVLLGGDENVIEPQEMHWLKNGEPRIASTDHYYSNVLSQWPQDHDAMNISLTRDLYVGRIPARNLDDVQVFINKYYRYRISHFYTNYTDHMAFIATNVLKHYNSSVDNHIISQTLEHIPSHIEVDFIGSDDLVDPNGCATVVLDKFNARDYSFLYGMWHGGDSYCIYDYEYNHQDPWYVLNFSNNTQRITINEHKPLEGAAWYDPLSGGGYDYYYVRPHENYFRLEDEMPNNMGNTYFAWFGTCYTTDFNYESSHIPVLRDSTGEIIVTGDNPEFVEEIPETLYQQENTISKVFFNEVGGPVGLLAPSADDYPYTTNRVVRRLMDIMFDDGIHEIGYLLDYAWEVMDNIYHVRIIREMIVSYTLFGDPSMQLWSDKSDKLVLGVSQPGSGRLPYFRAVDSSGNAVPAVISVLDENGEIQSRGVSTLTINSTIPDEWTVTANYPNFIREKVSYEDIKSNSGLPYSLYFTNGVDKNWLSFTSDPEGRVLVTDEFNPNYGSKLLLMDSQIDNLYSVNEAWLHIDLENYPNNDRVLCKFHWKQFDDNTDPADGVYISDDNGQSFVQVFTFPQISNSWQETVLDIDNLMNDHGLQKSDNMIIKFQYASNSYAPTDGIVIDDVRVYNDYHIIPFADGFEAGQKSCWEFNSSTSYGRVEISDSYGPHSGIYHLIMDVDNSNYPNLNEALLHLKLGGENSVKLKFDWKKYSDSNYVENGVFFSDDGGANFEKAYSFNVGEIPDDTWRNIEIDVSAKIAELGLVHSNYFVIKFQQYGEQTIPREGFAFDNIEVYRDGGTPPDITKSDNVIADISNAPNPFNPSTTISFAIPEESVVKIEIFNIKGQKVKTLIDDHLVPDEHKIIWDGDDDSGRQVSSGVYFYRLEVNGKTEAVDKCLLLK